MKPGQADHCRKALEALYAPPLSPDELREYDRPSNVYIATGFENRQDYLMNKKMND